MVFQMSDFDVAGSYLDSCGGDLEQEIQCYLSDIDFFISVAERSDCPLDLKIRIANLIGLCPDL